MEDHQHYEPSKYFELEQSVQLLRPLVVQVLKSQCHPNSPAAVDLRRGIRKVREVCKQLRAETVYLSKQQRKLAEQSQSQSQGGMETSGEQQPSSKKHKAVQPNSAAVVGNSPSGMNFVIMQPAEDQKVPVA